MFRWSHSPSQQTRVVNGQWGGASAANIYGSIFNGCGAEGKTEKLQQKYSQLYFQKASRFSGDNEEDDVSVENNLCSLSAAGPVHEGMSLCAYHMPSRKKLLKERKRDAANQLLHFQPRLHSQAPMFPSQRQETKHEVHTWSNFSRLCCQGPPV